MREKKRDRDIKTDGQTEIGEEKRRERRGSGNYEDREIMIDRDRDIHLD